MTTSADFQERVDAVNALIADARRELACIKDLSPSEQTTGRQMYPDSWRRLDLIERLCTALEQAEAATAGQWQAISTAPMAWVDVVAERKRQIDVEQWTPEHDDKHHDYSLANAAACYAKYGYPNITKAPDDWPWHSSYWKPSDRRRSLVKAAALILAEIERLDRLPSPPSKP